MKFLIGFSAFLSMMLLVFSCTKDYYHFYGKVIEGQYIRATINGELKVMQATDRGISNNVFDFRRDDSLDYTNYDQLSLARYTDDGREKIQLHIFGQQIDAQTYPLDLTCEPHFQEPCLPASIGYTRYLSIDEKEELFGQVAVVIDSWDENGFVNGTFSGVIRGKDQDLEITNGEFHLWVFKRESR